ncbi:MAG: apolipoprotein N-acyltransferase [Pseudomonadales bacterium]
MNYARVFYALLAGAFITLSLAPFDVWALALLAAALLFHVLQNTAPRTASLYIFLYSAALFGSGASWVYVSIHEFGFVAKPLAIFLTVLFCASLALINTFAWLPYTHGRRRRLDATGSLRLTGIMLFAATALFAEWFRSWIFSGFPWLYAGYSQVTGPLAGWAPLGGVYLVSFLIYLSGALLAALTGVRLRGLRTRQNRSIAITTCAVAGCWLLAPLLTLPEWTREQGQPRSVSLVQANISQHDKWRPEKLLDSLSIYRSMSENEWPESELVVWPEAAVAREFHASKPFLSRMDALAGSYSSSLLTGVPYRSGNRDGEQRIHNSVVMLGNGEGVYHKRKLVPFGEFIPFESMLGPLLEIIALPLSSMGAGDAAQQSLRIQDWQTLPLICYEIVYPGMSARAARQSDVLLTISNDAWFGRSLGPLQHLQMAQMRALENGRYLLRGTGSGISAVIDNRGRILQQSKQFTAETLRGKVYLRTGTTPWSAGGYWIMPLANCLLIIALLLPIRRSSA